MCMLSHRVRQLQLMRVSVMMNGCLVCWFLWGLSGSFHPWQAGSLKGANRGDVQLPVVTHSASHPTHLRT